jgi:hypothetical protein
MSTFRHIASSLILASLPLLVPTVASAQDADLAEIQRYSLSEAALAKYTNATKSLAELGARCEDDESGQESESQSIDAMVATIGSVPGASDAVQAAGMTLREYVVFSMSLLQNGLAAWAANQPGGTLPPGVSKANVDFVTKHDAELKQLAALDSRDTCGDE